MKQNFFRITAMLLLLSFFLSGCGNAAGTPAAAAITFTDALGRAVTLAQPPQRVAALIGSFADVWLLAGGSICATAEEAWEDLHLPLPDAVNIGDAHKPNLELLLSADPDFVLASASTASNVELGQVLESAGIPVAYFDIDNFSDYLSMLKICTDITGRKDLYRQNGEAIKTQIDAIRAQVNGSNLSDRQRTVLLLRISSGSVKAKGSSGTILGEMLKDLGCINIADSDTSLLEALSAESVIRQEPYRIFAVTMGNDTKKAEENLQKLIDEDPAWSSLDAVRSGRLHLMDRTRFNMKPNARWAESYEELKAILLDET